MNEPGKKILYFYLQERSFVKSDIEILGREHQLVTFEFNASPKWKTPWLFIVQFFFLLRHIRSSHMMVAMFAGYHTVLPALMGRIFGRPTVFILGGFECFSYPQIGYGAFRKGMLSRAIRYSLRSAFHLVPVDAWLVKSKDDYNVDSLPEQGYETFCGPVAAGWTQLDYSYDPEKFFRGDIAKQPRSFVTAGFCDVLSTVQRKGIDLIFQMAPLFPDCTFTVIGMKPMEGMSVPPNIQLVPPVPYSELRALYARHRFYLQLSMAEGFPSAICEAMLCECIPIGSTVAAIPRIMGGTGYLLERRDPQLLQALLAKALQEASDERGLNARNQIANSFPPGRRDKVFLSLMREVARSYPKHLPKNFQPPLG